MSDVQIPTAAAPDPGDTAAAEHLARLHKMSTTAGVTNQDYVAVNQTAVVALILGLLSALALVSWLFLSLTVAGVIVAIVALRQIRASAGTQSGRPIAWAALALCLAFGVAEGAMEVSATMKRRADEQKIDAVINQVAGLIRDAKYREAYRLFDDDFQNRVSPKEFDRVWTSAQAADGLGRLETLAWNGVEPRFLPAGGSRLAYVNARIKFPRANEQRVVIVLRQVGSEWQLANMPAFFPDQQRSQQQQQDDLFQIPEGQ